MDKAARLRARAKATINRNHLLRFFFDIQPSTSFTTHLQTTYPSHYKPPTPEATPAQTQTSDCIQLSLTNNIPYEYKDVYCDMFQYISERQGCFNVNFLEFKKKRKASGQCIIIGRIGSEGEEIEKMKKEVEYRTGKLPLIKSRHNKKLNSLRLSMKLLLAFEREEAQKVVEELNGRLEGEEKLGMVMRVVGMGLVPRHPDMLLEWKEGMYWKLRES